jgi:hypothetical protein
LYLKGDKTVLRSISKIGLVVFTIVLAGSLPAIANDQASSTRPSELCEESQNGSYDTVMTLSTLSRASFVAIVKEVKESKGDCIIYRLNPKSTTYITITPNSTVRPSTAAEIEFRKDNYVAPVSPKRKQKIKLK